MSVCFRSLRLPVGAAEYGGIGTGALLVGAGVTRLTDLERLLCLQVLDLSNNAVGSLVESGAGDFAKLPFLQTLILDGNQLKSLHGMTWPKGLASFSAAVSTHQSLPTPT